MQVPSGNVLGMPVGISFIGTAFSEPTLIRLASGFEAATHARILPTFTGNITTSNTNATTFTRKGKLKKDNSLPPHHM